MENARIADIFSRIADLIELKGGNEFRVRSYRNAARTVRNMSERLEDLDEQGKDLSEINNIGSKTAEKIHEILEKGTCRRLEDLKEEVPAELSEVMKVPQLGPRKAMKLHQELGVDSIDDLKQACEKHKVREIEGFGEKTERNILEGLQTLEKISGRALYHRAEEVVQSLAVQLDDVGAIRKWEVAGSFRRCKETVGDLDILVQARDRKKAADAITDFDEIAKIISRGKEKVSIRLESGMQVDFRFFESDQFGAAMMYFTGSKAHNIALRKIAVGRDWKLNEYGLYKGKKLLAGNDEEALYHRLNLAWVPPELREDRGEVQAAENDELPKLIEAGDVRGDLQSHTTASDGENSIREMGEAAEECGYDFFAITDHTTAVSVTQGLDEDAAKKHAEMIRRADNKVKPWLMAGIEVDVLKSGKLDLDEDVLASLDWVVASIHSHWKLGKKKMTDRLVAAIESGVVHCIGHPTGRLFGKRDPIEFDMDRIFEACAEHNVFLEINGQPDRLDLPATHVQRAREAGVSFTLGTDSHKTDNLYFMRYAVNEARRGWLEKSDVLNCCTVRQLRKKLKRK